MQIKISLTGAIYHKLLSVSLANLPQSSQIVNLASVDVQRFEDASQFMHFLWAGPFELLLVTYFMYMQIGPASLLSILVLLFLIPLQVITTHLVDLCANECYVQKPFKSNS
jgi:ABC-type transport system involved in cytochrome bd biosynthesis fused ATPase/permease subunit